MGYHKGKLQISTYVPADMKRAVRVRAAIEGRTFNAVVERALSRLLATEPDPKKE